MNKKYKHPNNHNQRGWNHHRKQRLWGIHISHCWMSKDVGHVKILSLPQHQVDPCADPFKSGRRTTAAWLRLHRPVQVTDHDKETKTTLALACQLDHPNAA
jgi:hypothetical protein